MTTCSTDLIVSTDSAGNVLGGFAPCFASLPASVLQFHLTQAAACLDEAAFDSCFCDVVALLACASLAEAYPALAQAGGSSSTSPSGQPLQSVRVGDLAYAFGPTAGNSTSGNAIAAGYRARADQLIEQQSSRAATWVGGGPVIITGGGC